MSNKQIQFGLLLFAAIGSIVAIRQCQIQQHASKPQLQFVSSRTENGIRLFTVQNTSDKMDAAIYSFTFVVSDQPTLKAIEAIYPKVAPPAELPNEHDDVVFWKSGWFRDGTFFFTKRVEYHVPAGKANTFRMVAADDKLAGMTFIGTVEIEYAFKNEVSEFRQTGEKLDAQPTANFPHPKL